MPDISAEDGAQGLDGEVGEDSGVANDIAGADVMDADSALVPDGTTETDADATAWADDGTPPDAVADPDGTSPTDAASDGTVGPDGDASSPDAETPDGDASVDAPQLPDGSATEDGTIDAAPDGDTQANGDAPVGDDVQADAGVDAGPVACTTDAECADGKACTGDLCLAGFCSHYAIVACDGPLQPCDAGHPCVTGVCDPERSACVPCVVAADCGGGFACQANACVPAAVCKSDVDCKAQGLVCAKADGACVDCNLNADCGKGQACIGQKCEAQVACASSKDCPAVCNTGTGTCVACVDSTDCPTGQACSDLNACVPATCVAIGCQGDSAFACANDGWSYTSAVACPDENSCTTDGCLPGTGCVHSFSIAPCSDGNACTTEDVCGSGSCQGTSTPCDDGNPCTVDSCDPASGCKATAAVGPCDDGNACTGFDVCVLDLCVGTTVSCDDNNLCTLDACDPGDGCRNNTLAGAPCDDGDACTLDTMCVEKVCGGGKAADCNDGNACSVDSCDKQKGCENTASDGSICTDGNACTKDDVCSGPSCVGKPLTCSDGNVCTTDSCTPASGCQFAANQVECSDGDPCTWPDVCEAEKCVGTQTANCSDGLACTADSCDGKGGCTYAPLNGGELCNDGDACTVADGCAAGACVGTPKDCSDDEVCTTDSCTAGVCKWTNNTVPCNDNNGCTLSDTCSLGACVPGKPVDCAADTKGCGGGTCVALSAQTWKCTVNSQPNGSACDADGSGCTVGDSCQNGLCVAGPTQDCSGLASNTACKVGACKSLGPSQNQCELAPAPLATPCNADSNGCTAGDACDGNGVCAAGAAVNCAQDPGNCFAGACVSSGNTTYTCAGGDPKPNGSPCNADNNGCTLDFCTAGACGVGTAPDCSDSVDACHTATCIAGSAQTYVCVSQNITCNDNNPCTDDACVAGTGCVYTSNKATCTDSNACTLGDVCTAGVCKPGSPANCADADLCTVNSCDLASGCTSTALDCSDGKVCSLDSCSPQAGCAHQAIPDCADTSLPYFQSFACGTLAGWTLGTTPENGVAWAIDATAELPGWYSPACSLNFNNGKNFVCTIPITSSAVSPPFDTTKVPAGTHLAMSFMLAGAWEGLKWDELYVDVSVDQGQTWSIFANPPPPAISNTAPLNWVRKTVDLTSLVGTTFQIRLRFVTADCYANSTVGVFVDDVSLYTTSCTKDSECNDQNGCTSDSCQKALSTCSFVPNNSACTDGNACTTTDFCAGGSCVYVAVVACDDGNVCTLDACDKVTGNCTKTSVPAMTACSDGSPCTEGDLCANGACAPGPQTACDDGNVCTIDSCSSVFGLATCGYTSAPNGTGCVDDNACTKNDVCSSGTCAGVDSCTYSQALSENFNCGGALGWTLPAVVNSTVKWAVDATPASPGYYSASCSLNLNDGITYGSTVPLATKAISPAFLIGANTSVCVVSLYSFGGVSALNSELRTLALVDTTTGQDLVSRTVLDSEDGAQWSQVSFDCSAAIGHTAKLEVRFSDVGSLLTVLPVGVGWFIDDVKVTLGK